MKRYKVLLIVLIAGFVLINPHIFAGVIAKESTPKVDTVPTAGPFAYTTFKNNTTSSIVVNWWHPTTASTITVECGTTTSYSSTKSTSTSANYHHVELTGLTAGTTYHYRVNYGATNGPDQTFKTADFDQKNFTFAVCGDNRDPDSGPDQSYRQRHKDICDAMAGHNLAFQINVGDMTNTSVIPSNGEQYQAFYWAEQNLNKVCPVMISMGNHEVQPSGHSNSEYYFFSLYKDAYPTNGTTSDGNAGRTYTFNYGNSHFVCISSYQLSMSEQKNWLAADLLDVKNNHPEIKWTFAFMHAAMFSASINSTNLWGSLPERQAWGKTLSDNEVDMVFQGHNHVYERTYPIHFTDDSGVGTIVTGSNYTRYITSGLGGGPFNNSSTSTSSSWGDGKYIEVWYGASNLNKTGAAYITIEDQKLTLRFKDKDNIEKDTLVIDKTPPTPPTPTPTSVKSWWNFYKK